MARQKKRHISTARQSLKSMNTSSIGNSIEGLKGQAMDQLEYAKGMFDDASAKVKGYIRTNPEKALMIAEIGRAHV